MKVFIAGKDGQLAREFSAQLTAQAFTVQAPDEKELDITNAEAVRAIARSR
jgi:dTDP-4-dehydrorhamnose reductase